VFDCRQCLAKAIHLLMCFQSRVLFAEDPEPFRLVAADTSAGSMYYCSGGSGKVHVSKAAIRRLSC
jgi:hypothetical protein